MNVKSQVQDAASWYYSHVDPLIPNYENVQRYLRGPLIALTVSNILSDSLDRSSSSGKSDSIRPTPSRAAEVEEEKKSSHNDWRDYLLSSDDVGMAYSPVGQFMANPKAQEAYQRLSRRTQARMEAFLAGCALAAPNDMSKNSQFDQEQHQQPRDLVTLQEGLSGFGSTATGPRRGSQRVVGQLTRNISSTSSVGHHHQHHPQIQQEDLILRLDLYLRTLQRVRNMGEESVIAMEPPKAIKARAQVITNAFVLTAGTIRSVRHVLTRLLNCLTMEELAVEVLSDDIQKVIRRIVSEYEHGTSFASLAFLSTPEVNAESLLLPLIMKYLRYLQSNWEQVISACELERMLTRAIDPDMRNLLKTMEFRSIGHLLEVCHEQRAKLHRIELAPNVCSVADNINSLIHSKDAVRQAIRDLQREVITVNGHVLPPVTSRRDLLHLLGQTLNSRTLTAAERPSRKKKSPPKKKKAFTADSLGQNNPSDSDVTPSKSKENFLNVAASPESIDDSDFLTDESSLSEGVDPPLQRAAGQPKVRRRNFHLSTIDLLTRRLLIAGSRTGNGGDAYFVVRDLFGGEEVEVVPTPNVFMVDQMVRPGTIDILVRLASVTIKCHQSFDIYPKELVGECEPLIQFHTTTTETISLQEVRASEDLATSKQTLNNRMVGHHVDEDYATMLLQEQETSRTGWRVISIRPAIYERVETWGTPS